MLRTKYLPYFFLCALTLAHRLILFNSLQQDFDFLLSLTPELWTWQHLPVSILKDHLLVGMWYLQQNPPIPQLILGAIVKCADFPYQVAHVLLAVQAAIAAISGMLLYHLLVQFRVSRLLSIMAAAVFSLSADVILLEYNSFGQTFYENLCMPLLLAAVWVTWLFIERRERKYLCCLGLLVAALALTRASFGYFFLPVAVFLVLVGGRRKELLVFLLPVLLLQGGWTAKNQYLYGYFSLPATSWTGANLLAGLFKRNPSQQEAIRAAILAHPELYPGWFVAMTRQEGLIYWAAQRAEPYVPASVRAIDAKIAGLLPGNPAPNTLAQAMVAGLYQKVALQQAWEHPRQFVAGTLQSYRLFWHPIREYTRLFAGPLFVKKTAVQLWEEGGVEGFLTGGYEAGNVLVLQRKRHPFVANDRENFEGTKTGSALAPPYAALAMYGFNIASIHVFGPLLLLALWMYRQDIGLDRRWLLFLYLAYAYVAAVSSVGDHGENNRFRLAVEPVIWLLSIAIAVGWWRLLRSLRWASPPAGQRLRARAPSAPGNS